MIFFHPLESEIMKSKKRRKRNHLSAFSCSKRLCYEKEAKWMVLLCVVPYKLSLCRSYVMEDFSFLVEFIVFEEKKPKNKLKNLTIIKQSIISHQTIRLRSRKKSTSYFNMLANTRVLFFWSVLWYHISNRWYATFLLHLFEGKW